MVEKLSVSVIGFSVNAEGLWAIGATIIIVAMITVLGRRRAHEQRD
jgi:hypothetical protein